MKTPNRPAQLALLLALALGTAACLEPDEPLPDDPVVDNAPDTVIGYKMVQTVEGNDEKDTTIAVGRTITYQFIDTTTILGDGIERIPTSSWAYEKVAVNQAGIVLRYDGVGKSYESLYFDADDRTRGGYTSTILFETGQKNKHWGRFVITPLEGGGGNPGGGDPGGGGEPLPVCEQNDYGEIKIYSSAGDVGWISIYIDGAYQSRLDPMYAGGTPPTDCTNDVQGASFVARLATGWHSVSANADAGGSWSPDSVEIKQCGCTLYHLRP
jgi:hypothetical protein